MEIRKDNIIIKTHDGYTDNGSTPPTVEIIDAISGQPICKLKIKGVGHAFGQEWVERLEFEEVPIESAEPPTEIEKNIIERLNEYAEQGQLELNENAKGIVDQIAINSPDELKPAVSKSPPIQPDNHIIIQTSPFPPGLCD